MRPQASRPMSALLTAQRVVCLHLSDSAGPGAYPEDVRRRGPGRGPAVLVCSALRLGNRLVELRCLPLPAKCLEPREHIAEALARELRVLLCVEATDGERSSGGEVDASLYALTAGEPLDGRDDCGQEGRCLFGLGRIEVTAGRTEIHDHPLSRTCRRIRQSALSVSDKARTVMKFRHALGARDGLHEATLMP